jgi:hypothetical protein
MYVLPKSSSRAPAGEDRTKEAGASPQEYSGFPVPSYTPTPWIIPFREALASMAAPKSSCSPRLFSRLFRTFSMALRFTRTARSPMSRKTR